MGLLSSILEPLTGSRAAATAASDANFRGMQAEREMFDLSRGDMLEERAYSRGQEGTARGDMASAAGQVDASRSGITGMQAANTAAASPWISGGLESFGQYNQGVNQGFQFDLASDPVYGARIAELDKAMGNTQASRGMKLSGSTLAQLREATATEVGSAYGRQFDKYQSNLSNLFQGAQLGSNMQGSVMGVNSGLQGQSAGLAGLNTSLAGMSAGLVGSGNTLTSNLAQMGMQQGSNVAQGYQNQGAIQAQAATAPFQNLLAIGQTAASFMPGPKK